MISTEWIAGFLDGEGCFSIGTSKNNRSGKRFYYLRLSVHQIDKRPLSILVSRYGGSLRLVTSHNPNPIWEWCVSGRTAAKVMADVLPYLVVKKEQAELGLLFQSRKRERGGGPETALSDEELTTQHSIYKDMQVLKKIRYDEA